MHLKSLELTGFKSFGKKSELAFTTPITAIVGPNGSGKSNTADAFRFVLGEQSMRSLRGKRGEDLIWGGSSETPRVNRASVKLVLDNTARLLNVDFDEVVIERTVYRDGANDYLINGSTVRLKDITELLAGANIGASGHQIISQGEADRVLAATPRERRQMIEDALGLRVYQYKKEESRKKLEKTLDNKKQVEALRNENTPHLKFLERQMKKLEKAQELRTQLLKDYKEYLRREERHIAFERAALTDDSIDPTKQLRACEEQIFEIRKALATSAEGGKDQDSLNALEKELARHHTELAARTRTLGQIEGQIAYEDRRIDEEKRQAQEHEGPPIPYRDVQVLWKDLTSIFDRTQGKDGLMVESLATAIRDAQASLGKFIERFTTEGRLRKPDTEERDRLLVTKNETVQEIARVQGAITQVEHAIAAQKKAIEEEHSATRDLERNLYTLFTKQSELQNTLTTFKMREQTLVREEEAFKQEIGEGVALLGRALLEYKENDHADSPSIDLDSEDEGDRSVQQDRRRALEKLKIRLEEMGGASADEITSEYTEVRDRDSFLERELADLEKSAASLESLIKELERELADRFTTGMEQISTQFGEFFTLMFGGGSASLSLTSGKKSGGLIAKLFSGDSDTSEEGDGLVDEESSSVGVSVEVALPKKRVQSLLMLSGGERTLTSIALIFAMSQVNPPPFLILDETDAALDEANSRRYGDMIANLAQKSQLILITHNRETMSRAGVLFGITMGSDGVSRVLSVKLDDAVAVAK